MTSSEFTALRSDLRQVREEIGQVRADVSTMRASLASCQTRCHVESQARSRHISWTVAALTSVLAAVASAALTTLLGR